ncbi:Multicopper oxidase mco [Roseovarius sp. THAF27]|nr:Multicopper oxidase mco [Roseovarius sp. THAF27]
MDPTRRDVMALAGGLAGAQVVPGLAWAGAPGHRLTAAPAEVQLAPGEYPKTRVWAYDGRVPGSMLRWRQGEMFEARLVNGLDQPTTVHWHGLRLPNAMDGVPGMTQAAVRPGESFDYRFVLRDAGTFWYHPHANSLEQISRGLAGVLVVDEAEPPEVDAEEILVLDDWRLTEDAQLHPEFGNRHDMSHAGRLGNYITVNGAGELRRSYPRGTRLRVRLVNAATARIFRLVFRGMDAWVVALDAMPLEAPERIEQVEIGPAQRVDLIVNVSAGTGEEAIIGSVERDGTYATVSVSVAGQEQAMRAAPHALPPNDLPVLALKDARQVPLVMEGGAMRGLSERVRWQGSKREARALYEAGQFWAFNGQAGMDGAPLIEAVLGETVRVTMENRTAFSHSMHLHGQHFREVFPDGKLGPWRDTLVIHPDETREIAFFAENPGDWMFHCHMAAHQMSGMMNWIRIT